MHTFQCVLLEREKVYDYYLDATHIYFYILHGMSDVTVFYLKFLFSKCSDCKLFSKL